MGTSSKRINDKIKKMLKEYYSDDEALSKALPAEAIKMVNFSKYLDEVKLSITVKGVNKMFSGSSKPFSKYGINLEEAIKDEEKMNLLIEKILEEITNSKFDHSEQSILNEALKLAMSEAIINNISSSEDFLKLFFEELVFLILNSDMFESLLESNVNFKREDVNKILRDKANELVFQLEDELKSYLSSDADIDTLIKHIFNITNGIN